MRMPKSECLLKRLSNAPMGQMVLHQRRPQKKLTTNIITSVTMAMTNGNPEAKNPVVMRAKAL